MNPAPVGTRIQVISNSNNHHYRVGGIYRVHSVESDGNFKATDDMGVEADHLQWRDCQSVGLGWAWLRGQLDTRSVELLSAFIGLENLSLRQDVETHVISAMPDLAGRIFFLLPEIEMTAAEFLSKSADSSDDDGIDLSVFDNVTASDLFK